MKDWRKMRGKRVVVQASGLTYRGTVVEAGEQSLILRSPSGFQEIPWERISRMEEEKGGGPARPSALSAAKR